MRRLLEKYTLLFSAPQQCNPQPGTKSKTCKALFKTIGKEKKNSISEFSEEKMFHDTRQKNEILTGFSVMKGVLVYADYKIDMLIEISHSFLWARKLFHLHRKTHKTGAVASYMALVC